MDDGPRPVYEDPPRVGPVTGCVQHLVGLADLPARGIAVQQHCYRGGTPGYRIKYQMLPGEAYGKRLLFICQLAQEVMEM